MAHLMRGEVLSGDQRSWEAGPRTAAELEQAAKHQRRAAQLDHVEGNKLFCTNFHGGQLGLLLRAARVVRGLAVPRPRAPLEQRQDMTVSESCAPKAARSATSGRADRSPSPSHTSFGTAEAAIPSVQSRKAPGACRAGSQRRARKVGECQRSTH